MVTGLWAPRACMTHTHRNRMRLGRWRGESASHASRHLNKLVLVGAAEVGDEEAGGGGVEGGGCTGLARPLETLIR